MREGLPGNRTMTTEPFIVTKNGHIHQTAYFFPVANAWKHHLPPLDTTVSASYTPMLMGANVNNPV